MKDEADPNFVFSSTDKMLFVIVDINPTRTNHQHQNTVITFLSVTTSIHQLSRRKTRRRISRCHGDVKQARGPIPISQNSGNWSRPSSKSSSEGGGGGENARRRRES